METNNIYHYQDPRQFLLDTLSVKQKLDSSFSVRKWAKVMELKSHSLLAMLLQGKRDLRIQHSEFLQKGLELATNEQAYFQTLIQYSNCKTIEEKALMNSFLQDLHPGQDFATKDVSEFIAISNWVYMAILAMTELKDFKGTEEEICVRLGGRVVISEVRSAMIRLLDLKLVKWSIDGNLQATYNRISSKDDVSNEGVKEYHRQVLDLAKLAIDEQDVEEREFQSFTMAIAKEKLPLAKDMIRKFRSKLSKAVSGDGDNVYQTSIQLFQLTSNPESISEDNSVARDPKQQGKKC
jgi:uncharacterized protein (TIGR02147 family)